MPGPLSGLRNLFRRAPASRLIPLHEWQRGLPEEIGFWDEYLGATDGPYADERRERLDPTSRLQEWVTDLLPPGRSRYRLLDVGAGPLTWLGKTHPDFPFDLTAVDPLAATYDGLLAKHGIFPPVRTQQGAAEELTTLFAPASFDLVNARNCIDHSRDALLAIRQMVEMVKPGGVVFMQGHVREADRRGFSGLHQWNFWPHEGELWVGWVDAKGLPQSVSVNRMVRGKATITTRMYDDVWMFNFFRRTAS